MRCGLPVGHQVVAVGLLAGVILSGFAQVARAEASADATQDEIQQLYDAQTRATAKQFPTQAGYVPGYYQLPESQLGPAERTTHTPPNWTGDIAAPGTPLFVRRAIEAHDRFVQPLLNSAVVPDLAVRMINAAGWNPRPPGGAADLDQLLYVSVYAFEFYAPVLVLRDAQTVSTNHFRVGLRLPAMLTPNHAIAVFMSANIPVDGVWTRDGGFSTMLGYAYGGKTFTAQVRAGFGVDQLVAEVDSPRTASAFGDGAAGLHLNQHFELLLQADGRKAVGASGGTFRLFPGVRFFPLEHATLSVGASALWWIDSYGDKDTKRLGAIVDIGYLFL